MFNFNPEKKQSKDNLTDKAKSILKTGVIGVAGLAALHGGEVEGQTFKEKKVKPFVTSNYDEFLERKQSYDDSLFIAKGSDFTKSQLLDPNMTSNRFSELKKNQDTDPNLIRAFKNLNYPKPVETIEKKLPDEFSISGLFKGLAAMYGISDGPIEQAHRGFVKMYDYPKQEVVYKKPTINPEQVLKKVGEKEVDNIKEEKDNQKNTLSRVFENKNFEDTPTEKIAALKIESRSRPVDAISFEPSTPNMFGGKGQYVYYDSAGVPKVITKQEFDRLKELSKKVID